MAKTHIVIKDENGSIIEEYLRDKPLYLDPLKLDEGLFQLISVTWDLCIFKKIPSIDKALLLYPNMSRQELIALPKD
ncbi:MAG: hypothetical protein CL666_08770 [Balneola sp.]|nr:hypothetical protein [Balneola sp.]|tara:strand:+ start:5007 stop:5237 length:231 start_codon:yes stop_codon:yes gene_type:complete